jgi:hypothetical protein
METTNWAQSIAEKSQGVSIIPEFLSSINQLGIRSEQVEGAF